jgi:protochlorophyllide reductase
MTVSELDRRYHKDTGIIFSSMYPGCIAETALFREKRPWFRTVSADLRVGVTHCYPSDIFRFSRVRVILF